MGVVDEELRICPEYVSGQIAIGGYSLAEGYLGDTTLTKEKFVYVEEEKNRIYLTGDNGRYVENGDIEFLGRLDNQVKINGHRIEIAEIENAIRGMQNIEDCCVVYNQSIGKGVLIAFIKNKISSISYTKEEYRKQLAFFLPPAMIPSEFVNVERFPLSTNGKIDRKGLAESIQKNIKVKHNAKATLISQKKEYVELAKSIKKIVCSISGNDYIDYEDNLLENGLDSLLLSQISGRIVSDIQEAQGMRFDEILRASLTMPTIMGIPFLHMPRDEYGTLSINVEEEVNIPSGVTIGNVMLPSVKETFEQIWPDAVKKALEILFKQNRTEKMSMARLMEHNEVKERISLLPIDVGKYSFRDKISGVMCMGVLGHLKRDEQEKLLYKLDKNLNINVPILIELLEPKFLVAPVGSRISVATQGRLRYETYITDIKQVGMDQWTWKLTYKVFCGKNIVSTVDSLMSWNYQSVEKILNQLTKMHFRTAKLSETLLLAIKAR